MTGGLNQGLMMAKGTTLVVLDPNALVTPGWLDRLLECLHSDPRIGVVGPVTNGPFGEQQIEVPYTHENEARHFAISHNVSNPAVWRETKSLAGFCMLLRRDAGKDGVLGRRLLQWSGSRCRLAAACTHTGDTSGYCERCLYPLHRK